MTYAYRVRGVVPDGVRAALDDRYGPNGWTQEWNKQNFLRDNDNPEWMATQSLINQGVISKPEVTKSSMEIKFLVEERMDVGVMNLAAVNHLVFR